MSTYTEEVGKKLNALLEKTYDAEKGFKKAAENVENNSLKKYFNMKAEERYTFGHDLKTEIRSYNQEVDKGGSLTGAAHRTWMDIKAMFSMDDEESMLEEAITGEKAAVEEYNDVLKELSLPSSTKNLLESQRNKIENGLYNIKSLEQIN
ncbi:PA2169 family four-helix-bundle protein [Polaribacter haliotis]|uniref:PA2169 family four-helix-bundle protein n=1 Tax=Polaribacter haliotis TaxID=1888915 RepID=A0A7L8AEE0_9FLAO|nr:PA2169 family four-helix-bundle protein [Polaribacter haliotis]QOD60297.1 PA2169 family four-helix-bundle protein [Polaribacter haliotis]